MSAAVENFGLNVSNWVPTIWNLIPFSFVADYFSNIGDVVDALSFPSSDLAWFKQNQKVSQIDKVISNGYSAPVSSGYDTWEVTVDPGSQEVAVESFSRSAYFGALVPFLQLEIPGVSSKKWLNLSALAISLATTRRTIASLR